jgi:hypothetical protein
VNLKSAVAPSMQGVTPAWATTCGVHHCRPARLYAPPRECGAASGPDLPGAAWRKCSRGSAIPGPTPPPWPQKYQPPWHALLTTAGLHAHLTPCRLRPDAHSVACAAHLSFSATLCSHACPLTPARECGAASGPDLLGAAWGKFFRGSARLPGGPQQPQALQHCLLQQVSTVLRQHNLLLAELQLNFSLTQAESSRLWQPTSCGTHTHSLQCSQ